MRRKIIAAILCAAALCMSVFASGCSCGGESAGEGHKIAGAEEQVTAAVGIMNDICSAGERRGGLFSGDGRAVVPSAEPKDASDGGIADVADILDKYDLPHDVDLEARVAELYRRYILLQSGTSFADRRVRRAVSSRYVSARSVTKRKAFPFISLRPDMRLASDC